MNFHPGSITWGRSADGRLISVSVGNAPRPRVLSGLTADQRQQVVAAYKRGLSFAQIACEFDVSRNVVAGILYRAGNPDRPARRSSPAPRFVEPIEPFVPAKSVEPEQPYHPAGVSFMDLRANHCRWPLWKADVPLDEKRFCGIKAEEGKPYCAHCRGLSVAPRRTESFDKKHGFFKFTKRGRR